MLSLFKRSQAITTGTRSLEIYLCSPDDLEQLRQRALNDDDHLAAALSYLRAAAEKALELAPTACADKPSCAPSGDKRDYLSIGTYWWPNPDTADGLPYVRRDGEINPESVATDCGRFRKLTQAVWLLGLGYFYFADERYARHAAELTRCWFLDPQGGMTPHLVFSQCIPGVVSGRNYGIIDTCVIRYLIDGLGLLKASSAWTLDDSRQLKAWMSAFLDWLLSSQNGCKEAASNNNHGTWYDVQVVAIALYTGAVDKARSILQSAANARITRQIQADGSQPHEFKRSRPLTYVTMNLHAFCELASLGEAAGIDLWHYEGTNGASIKQAGLWLKPYLTRQRDWPRREIISYCPENYLSVFRRLAVHYTDAELEPENLPFDQTRVALDSMQLRYPRSQ